MREPDHVFDDYPINEYWWEWLEEINGIKPGDKIIVKTETREWKTPMEVIDENWEDEITFVSRSGKKYMIVTYSNNHPLEPTKPMVRTCDGFESCGVIEEVKIWK